MALLADEDVVVHYHPERLGSGHDLLGDLDIGTGRGRVARRMMCTSTMAVADSSSARFTTSRT